MDFRQIGINTEGINSFLKTKAGSGNIYFPKMKVMILDSNNIQSEALNALLETGIPNLRLASLARADNPNFINDIFSYPNKHTLLLA